MPLRCAVSISRGDGETARLSPRTTTLPVDAFRCFDVAASAESTAVPRLLPSVTNRTAARATAAIRNDTPAETPMFRL